MTINFAHLRVHTDHTLGRGADTAENLLDRAVKISQPALAITDITNMHGAWYFSKFAKKRGIQPILGVQLYLKVGKAGRGSIILLAQNSSGYENIAYLARKVVETERSPQETIDNAIVNEIFQAEKAGKSITEGIIAIGGVGSDSFITAAYNDGMTDEDTEKFVSFIANRFKGRFYVEICRNGYPTEQETEYEKRALNLALKNKLPIVGTTDVWYGEESRHDAFEILKKVSEKDDPDPLKTDGTNIISTSNKRYFMRSTEDMKYLFDDLPEAFDNASLIAMRCAYSVVDRKPILPPFSTGDGRTEAEELRHQAAEGLEKRIKEVGIESEQHDAYKKRLDFELNVIEKMGFPGYFLIVSDFIKWAKYNNIPVGPGRGSGAGSIVAWALTITDIDPIRFGLLFERFLNPDRVSMPDFDIDFCQDRREEVIKYVKRKYGSDFVAQISTFQEIKAKTAIKDVARILSTPEGMMSVSESNLITKMVPFKEGSQAETETLKRAYEVSSDFRNKVNDNPIAQQVFKNAISIEGLFRSSGSHAAGVVISDRPLTKLIPVGYDPKSEMSVVNFDMKGTEAVGLVKFDFLGLKTLSVIKDAVEQVKVTTGEDIWPLVNSTGYDDPAVYEMLQKGDSTGVFQLESDGMKRCLAQIKPTRLEDLIAVVSLYRPGPMEMIPLYARRKNNIEETKYPEPADRTKLFLEETHGIMVYQEQVMQVAQVVAGYTLGEADLLRRAMGKKIKEEMVKQKALFIEGAEKNGTPSEKASELFDLIEKFASYGFNKSHAAAYAVVAYQTAFLKCHYPAQFFSALLNYEIGASNSQAKMATIKHDMDQHGIKLLTPDVQYSHMRFSTQKDENGKWAVRFGLAALKGMTENKNYIDVLKDGKFNSLQDYYSRTSKILQSKHYQVLAYAGALDSITPDAVRQRAITILNFLRTQESAKKDTKTASLFDNTGMSAEIVIPKKIMMTEEYLSPAIKEYEVIGFYINGHPLDKREDKLKVVGGVRTRKNIAAYMRNKNLMDLPEPVKIRGMVEHVELKDSKNGKKRIDLKLGERDEAYTVRIFYPKGNQTIDLIYRTLDNARKTRMPVVIISKLQYYNDDYSVIGEQVFTDEEYLSMLQTGGTVEITIDTELFDLGDSKKIQSQIHMLTAESELPSCDPEKLLNSASEILTPFVRETLESIKGRISNLETTNKEGNPIVIRILTRLGQYTKSQRVILPNNYQISTSVRSYLRHLNGVKNIEESD